MIKRMFSKQKYEKSNIKSSELLKQVSLDDIDGAVAVFGNKYDVEGYIFFGLKTLTINRAWCEAFHG